MQHLPDNDKTDSKNKICRLERTIYKSRSNVCVDYQTDTGNVNIVVYSYQNKTYQKCSEFELKTTDYEKLPSKRVFS